ncbi:copper-binding protein [Burkholderia seminalis]|uniref:Copper-binding protein n=2 Tax=Burkholderia cepacia complex TaxID=87882 RepID=A0A8A8D6Q5_9BURK|nr:copper-binding protein [Burkholderia seminalis]QTO20396.1 copper-binding protein [Burkholderia seminalis]RQS86616.1 RND transporter MFP subunit [Burkholderia seminalis]
MKIRFHAAAVLCAVASVAMPVLAAGDMAGMDMGGRKMAAPDAALTDAEVKKVDTGRGMVTLRHGALDNVGMPAMTMAFKAGDAVTIGALRAGDKVRVRIERVDGVLTIVKLVKGP